MEVPLIADPLDPLAADLCQIQLITVDQAVSACRYASERIERAEVTTEAGSSYDFLIKPEEVTVQEYLGEGSTATVLKAVFRGEQIAVKELSMTKPEYTLAFQRELDVLVKVHHPNIVKFLGVIDAEHRPGQSALLRLCLEYCEGGSLWDLLYNKVYNGDMVKLAWWQRIVMLYDTATAVAYMHSFTPKVVHRDLKSLNVLLARPVEHELDEPIVKLCDFGFAREFDGVATLTAGAGTCHWMAPEVSSGHPYTEMADSFSFAMIGYEVVCRRIPFQNHNPGDVRMLLRGGTRPLTQSPTGGYEMINHLHTVEQVPPGLLELIELCWHQDPRQRPTFTKIWQDLIEVSRNTSEELKIATPEKLFGRPC
jgi:serine/threonine protein kinase